MTGWWHRLDEYEWPGRPWPEGGPEFVGSWRWRVGSVVAAIVVVGVMLGLGEAGVPTWLAVPLGLAVGLAPLGVFVARLVFREAKRQGFRRDTSSAK